MVQNFFDLEKFYNKGPFGLCYTRVKLLIYDHVSRAYTIIIHTSRRVKHGSRSVTSILSNWFHNTVINNASSSIIYDCINILWHMFHVF